MTIPQTKLDRTLDLDLEVISNSEKCSHDVKDMN